MSNIGEAAGAIGGEALGAFMGIPLAIICVFAAPFMLVNGCNKHIAEKKAKVERAAKVYEIVSNPKQAVKHPILTYKSLELKQEPIINTPKESLSFRAGQAVKQSTKDFARGLFTKKTQ